MTTFEPSGAQRSPADLARQLKGYPPTAQQEAIIGADPNRSHLVVAGAGSGKTETIADRVVWLVANGHAQPNQILGLTFTRKAAAELDERIVRQLNALRRFDAASTSEHTLGSPAAEVLHQLTGEGAEVSTYNAFAAQLYRNHAALIGRDPEAVVITEATAWQLVWQIVERADAVALDEAELTMSQVCEAVLRLARQMAEHDALADRVAEIGSRVHAIFAALLRTETTKGRRTLFDTLSTRMQVLPVLVQLAGEFQRAKRREGLIEFSDQMALGLEILRANPAVVAEHRDRYRFVLLDEYQDTSVLQTRFFATLFASHPVIAVGDPDQSIYGFRGASADNLLRFGDDFSTDSLFHLSTSWRNPIRVLNLANTLSAQIPRRTGFAKPALEAKPGAISGDVALIQAADLDDEIAQVGQWLSQRLAANRLGPGGGMDTPPTAAVLLRARKYLGRFAEGLRAQGLSVHLTGAAGVLDEPVVVDLVAMLRAVSDPLANSELVRVLTSGRWNLGTRDVAQLHAVAKRLLRETRALDSGGADPVQSPATHLAHKDSLEPDDVVSLSDALDVLAEPGGMGRYGSEFSAAAQARLPRLALELRHLRRHQGMPLGDFVEVVSREILLDIEAEAHDAAPYAKAALESFADLIAEFSRVTDRVSLAAFLDWLEAVDAREDVAFGSGPAEPGVVQLLTVHAAKGLEWDYVALGRVVEGEMPSVSRDNGAWLASGELPWSERGDARELPELPLAHLASIGDDGKSAEKLIDAFKEQVKAHYAAEEQRVSYVAVTRARRGLLLSSSAWTPSAKRPKKPSSLLRTAADVWGEALTDAQALAESGQPAIVEAEVFPRPDLLASRRPRVELAAGLVRQANPQGAISAADGAIMAALARERTLAVARPQQVPVRIAASRAKDFMADLSLTLAQARRPRPQPPYRATRLGTLFHQWVENRSASREATLIDLDDNLGIDDTSSDRARLAQLQRTFAASPWAERIPVDMEREIHYPIAGHLFICKLDAVYAITPETPDEPGRPAGVRWQIVDWKTGLSPSSPQAAELRQWQLTLYRLAYARRQEISPDEIDAVFFYVAENRIVRPGRTYSEAEFISRWGEMMGSVAT